MGLMITPTTAARRHAEIAEHMRSGLNDPWRLEMFESLRMALSSQFDILRPKYAELSPAHEQAAREVLSDIARNVGPALAECRTYLIDETLGQSLPAVLDQLDPDAMRCEPPEGMGIVWLSTPMTLPTPSGFTQYIDALSWVLVNIDDVAKGSTHDADQEQAYIVTVWTHDEDRGPDDQWKWMLKEYERRHGEPRPESEMKHFRIIAANGVPRYQRNGPVRMELSDDVLDDLASTDLDLVVTDGLGISAVLSAIWGTLTGELGAIDSGGTRSVDAHDAETNRAATKRARRQGRNPKVRVVTLGARREHTPTPPDRVGTGLPLAVQAYTPGYYRRPHGTPPGTPRTKWVPGFWRGDPSLPVSQTSAVYVARAPRTGTVRGIGVQ